MERRKFSREFKIEAVRLIRERGVSVAQAARDLDLHENTLRRWVKELAADPSDALPGQGQMKPEQLEIERLRREVAKLRAERDILKRPRPSLGRPPFGLQPPVLFTTSLKGSVSSHCRCRLCQELRNNEERLFSRHELIIG
jgi:transposase